MTVESAAQRIADADDAEAALARFLRPAFEAVRSSYYARIVKLTADPLDDKAAASIKKLGLAIRIADEARSQIEQIVQDGKLARDEQQNTRRVEAMPETTRRYF